MGLGWLLLLAGGVLHGWWLLHGYLTNASAFPQPLSADEEKAALQALCRGDSDARRRLIEHNLRLVAHIVKKFEGCGEDTEDLIQIGTVGLIKGVETYRHDKGTRLATYAARCIENDSLLTFRGANPCQPVRDTHTILIHCGPNHYLPVGSLVLS